MFPEFSANSYSPFSFQLCRLGEYGPVLRILAFDADGVPVRIESHVEQFAAHYAARDRHTVQFLIFSESGDIAKTGSVRGQ